MSDMDIREHIAGRAAGFNARAASMGPISRLFLIAVAILAMLLVLLLAIPILLIGVVLLVVLRLYLRLKLWWAGDPTRFHPNQVDNEGRQNVRVRVPDEM